MEAKSVQSFREIDLLFPSSVDHTSDLIKAHKMEKTVGKGWSALRSLIHAKNYTSNISKPPKDVGTISSPGQHCHRLCGFPQILWLIAY